MLRRAPNGRLSISFSKACEEISRGWPRHINPFTLRRPRVFISYTHIKHHRVALCHVYEHSFVPRILSGDAENVHAATFLDNAVGDRVRLGTEKPATSINVLDWLRELIFTLSKVPHFLRLSSFNDEDIKMPLAAQRRKVRLGDGSDVVVSVFPVSASDAYYFAMRKPA